MYLEYSIDFFGTAYISITDVKFDNYVVAVDSYQKQIYQLDLTSGDVSAIPLSQSYKGVALDIHKVTGRLYWTDNSMGVIVTSNIDGSDETIFRKLPNGNQKIVYIV